MSDILFLITRSHRMSQSHSMLICRFRWLVEGHIIFQIFPHYTRSTKLTANNFNHIITCIFLVLNCTRFLYSQTNFYKLSSTFYPHILSPWQYLINIRFKFCLCLCCRLNTSALAFLGHHYAFAYESWPYIVLWFLSCFPFWFLLVASLWPIQYS